MLKKYLYHPRRNACYFYQIHRNISNSEVTATLRPFYFLVHPDLFARYPRAQHINDVNLKLLNSHLDSLINCVQTGPLHLQFYIKSSSEDVLKIKSLELADKTAKKTLQKILRTFRLPTKYVDLLQDKTPARQQNSNWNYNFYYGTHFNQRQSIHNPKSIDDLYSWLVKNMGEAEKRLHVSEPIRRDIERLEQEIVSHVGLRGLSWERGIGTTHLRGCLQGLRALTENYPLAKNKLKGRHVHFGNETGVSVQGSLILSTSEVRDQWLQLISRVDTLDSTIRSIPYMQKAVSNSLRNIQVTHRKYQPFMLAEAYSERLKRLITSLGDFLGKSGFPANWPVSLSHLQLVVESASGPLMLSPTGQIIAPSSCPPWLLVTFISDNMEEAFRRISNYESIKEREKELHRQCMEELRLSFLDKDDSVSPALMLDCLSRLIRVADRISPLLVGARLWITQYYSVMLDGEVCIPFNWDKSSD